MSAPGKLSRSSAQPSSFRTEWIEYLLKKLAASPRLSPISPSSNSRLTTRRPAASSARSTLRAKHEPMAKIVSPSSIAKLGLAVGAASG
jgi:hypothetical protein